MKNLSFPLFVLFISLGLLSCTSTPDEASQFDPATLVGTKWVFIDPPPGITGSLEFEDNRFCLWSFMGHQILMEYIVRGKTITLANNTSYIVDGDILLELKAFSKKPLYTKI